MRYTHTNIISTNWKALADFYINVFGCKLVPPVRKQSGQWLADGTGVAHAALQGAHLALPGYDAHGPTLEIYQYEHIKKQDPVLPNTRGFGHIAFEVDKVETVLERFLAHGGTTFGKITKRAIAGVGIITFVYSRDPEGNLIELQSWE